jgi:hypothetical protein
MKLVMADLMHIHKVLSSDVAECEIHIKSTSRDDGFKTRMGNRILENQRVLAKVERIIGRKPVYA